MRAAIYFCDERERERLILFFVGTPGPIRLRSSGLPRFVKELSTSSQSEFERSKARFARMHYKRQSRQEMLEKERIGQKQAQVQLHRKYRAGELPDIQITNQEIIQPLKFLCHSDILLAKTIAVEIITEIITTEESEDRQRRLVNVILATRPKHNRYLASSILEIGLNISPKLLTDIDVESLKLMCLSHNLSQLGVLLLEGKPSSSILSDDEEPHGKRYKSESTNQLYGSKDIHSIMALYKDCRDYSSARGIYLQEMKNCANPKIVEALTHESMKKYDQAMLAFKYLRDNDADGETWNSFYYQSLENLCAWENILNENSNFSELVGNGDEKMLANYYQALICQHKNQRESIGNVYEYVVNSGLNDIQEKFAHEISLFARILNCPLEEAKEWDRKALRVCRSNWSDKSPYDLEVSKRLIYQCQRLALSSRYKLKIRYPEVGSRWFDKNRLQFSLSQYKAVFLTTFSA